MSESANTVSIPSTGLPAGVKSHVATRRPRWKTAALGLLIGVSLPLLIAWLIAFMGGYRYQPLTAVAAPESNRLKPKQKLELLEKRIASFAPKGIYVVVDTARNHLYLKKNGEVLLDAVCSTGTGGVLTEPGSGRQWVFETPLGLRKIQEKKRNPVWNKPDWAFVEEGKKKSEVPPNEWYDTISLGDFAIDIGNGYKIHGTPYKRMLGQSVTHGCIRLGDEDLEKVYNAVQIGTPVYLF
jgi:L,D-transpeptidase YbiS